MIKIEEHLISSAASFTLPALSLRHWRYLNPKYKNKPGYQQRSLIEKCKHFSHQSTLAGYRQEYANDSTVEALRHRSFFRYLLRSRNQKLKLLITGVPSELSTIKIEIMTILQESDLYIIVNGKRCQTPFGKLLSKIIFNYAGFRGSESCKQLLINLKFNATTCPYCNDNKIRVIEVNKQTSAEQKKLALLDLDHFYPKAQNPFFAVSFYNLIPTCHDCNSGIKGDKSFSIETHVNPYHEAFDDLYTFRLSLMALLGDRQDHVEIIPSNNKPLDRTSEDMALNDRYSEPDKIQEAKDLVDFFVKHKHQIGTQSEEMFFDSLLKGHKVPIRKSDILGKNLGKLKRDILKQIDIHDVLGIQP